MCENFQDQEPVISNNVLKLTFYSLFYYDADGKDIYIKNRKKNGK